MYAHDGLYVVFLRALGSEKFSNLDKKLSPRARARLHMYYFRDGQLNYSTDELDTHKIVVPHAEDIKYRIIHELHDSPIGGLIGREKIYNSVSRHCCLFQTQVC